MKFNKIMIRIAKKIVCLILLCTLICASTIPVLGVSDNSSALEEQIDEYVQQHEDTTAAVSVAAFDSRSVWFQKAYGYADKEKGCLADADTVFEWGSVSKLLVWTSVMQLWEQGKIDLNSDIKAYLPDGFFKKLKYDTPITMLNLMNHNAGWQEVYCDLFVTNISDIPELGDALQKTEPPQVYRPGEVCAYSNWSAALAAYIVECISGQSFTDYVHTHIFKPLGMEHTALSATLSDNEWVQNKRTQLKCYTADNKPLGTSLYYIPLYPAGMAVGTLGDFLTFARALLPDDHQTSPLFCSHATLDEMFSPTLYYGKTDRARNCHGFWTLQFGTAVIGHGGNTVGCSSYLLIDPQSKKGIVVMTNQANEWIYNDQMMPLIFGEYTPSAEGITTDSNELSGVYMDARTCLTGCFKLFSMVYTRPVTAKNGALYMFSSQPFATQIAPDTYLRDQGIKSILYSQINDDHSINLQLPYGDMIKVSTGETVAKAGLLLLAAAAILYCLITLITDLIGFIARLVRKKKRSASMPRLVRNFVRGDVVAAACNISVLIIRALSYKTSSALEAQLILNIVLLFIPILYAGYLIFTWRKLEGSKSEKLSILFTAVAGLVMTVNIVFWEYYKIS